MAVHTRELSYRRYYLNNEHVFVLAVRNSGKEVQPPVLNIWYL